MKLWKRNKKNTINTNSSHHRDEDELFPSREIFVTNSIDASTPSFTGTYATHDNKTQDDYTYATEYADKTSGLVAAISRGNDQLCTGCANSSGLISALGGSDGGGNSPRFQEAQCSDQDVRELRQDWLSTSGINHQLVDCGDDCGGEGYERLDQSQQRRDVALPQEDDEARGPPETQEQYFDDTGKLLQGEYVADNDKICLGCQIPTLAEVSEEFSGTWRDIRSTMHQVSTSWVIRDREIDAMTRMIKDSNFTPKAKITPIRVKLLTNELEIGSQRFNIYV